MASRNDGRLRLAAVALALLGPLWSPTAPAASEAVALPGDGSWTSDGLRDHPLAGRIWLPAEGRSVTPEALVERMARAGFVLLGERHDNPDHHRIQAWVTDRLLARGRRPALVMEMFREGQQARIDAHLADRPGNAEGLGVAAGWAESGWPPWRHYAPIVRPVLARGLPLIAANPDRATTDPVRKEGFGALPPEEAGALALDETLPDSILSSMDREIVEAHCGYIGTGQARPLTRVQILRDARFARAMIEGASRAEAAILIAGAGHVRRDRGVPFHLARQGIGRERIFALGIVEVVAESPSPQDYGAAYGTGRPPFDAVWFTPRTAREDPCKAFESLKKNK